MLFDEINQNIQLLRKAKKIKYPVNISVGISRSSLKDAKKIKSALKKADRKMYEHKLIKRNESERNLIDVNKEAQ